MRAFAITGIVTACWMPAIISGSDMRATPPSRRMSAGTRSSAITAAAPASSATFACSGVTTSMITPPLSISARPLLTRNVASSRMPGVYPRERGRPGLPRPTRQVASQVLSTGRTRSCGRVDRVIGPTGLGDDTKAVLLAAAAMFLQALLLGVWKYRQMATSETHLAHPYLDTAHRAALLYSFALLLIA